jgi:thiamine biosynthesis protein ThiS
MVSRKMNGIVMMKILVNGISREFEESTLSITTLLQKLNYTFPHIIVRYQGNVIEKQDFCQTILKHDDTISIYHLICGG